MPEPGQARTVAIAVGSAVAAAHLVPSVAAIGPLRRRLLPGLCGIGRADHVALSFDDGPDPASTPAFLDALDAADVRASFFVLGEHLARHHELLRRIADSGHDVGVHGWTHRANLLCTPTATAAELTRTVDRVREVTGRAPRYWRPPYGIPTGAGLLAARRLRLRPVLWTADGRDWRAGSSAAGIVARIGTALAGGGVILLHDSDRMAAAGAWRGALAALPLLLARCAELGLRVGPLSQHGLTGDATAAGSRASR